MIMAGTGSPRLDPKRGPAWVVVIAGGEFMLFDAGEEWAMCLKAKLWSRKMACDFALSPEYDL